MKKLFIIMMMGMISIGCASRESTPQYPCNIIIRSNSLLPRIQGKVVEGSTWVWNEATHTWNLFTSEENMERIRKAWAAAKRMASDTYDETVKALQDQK